MLSQGEGIPFAKPDIGAAEMEAVIRVMRSGWLTTGPECKAFETEFARAVHPSAQAIAVNSATAGFDMLFASLGLEAGAGALFPAITFASPATAAWRAGLKIELSDVDPDTGMMDCGHADAAITPNTRVVVPTHMSGRYCEVSWIRAVADECFVVDDAAHCLPGPVVGNQWADATVFSLYATKPICSAEGGVVVTQDEDLAARLRTFRLHGFNRDAFDRYRNPEASWQYDIVQPGFKANMPDILAAVARVQLDRRYELKQQRAAAAGRLREALSPLIGRANLPTKAHGHDWHLYVVHLPPGARPRVCRALADAGIGHSVHFTPLYRFTFFRERVLDARCTPEHFPGAEAYFARCLSLPLHAGVTEEVAARIAKVIGDAIGGAGA